MASSSPGDLNVSMTQASDELHEMHCEQCDLYNEREIADCFCVECMEYMCKSCLKYHKRQNPNHTQQNKDTMPQDFCFEKCATHSNKLIKYYCFLCRGFACSDCKRTEHEKCTGIGHVPTLAKGVENCDELNRLFKSIEDVTEELDKSKEAIVMKISQSSSQRELIIEAAKQLREEMNKRLNEQNKLITDHYDKEIEKSISKLEAERKKKINQMYDKQRQVDDLQHEVLEEKFKTVELRTKTEQNTLNVLLMKNEKVSTDTKQLSDDIELKKKIGDRSKMFLAMMKAKQNLGNLEKELHRLQNVTRERSTSSELQTIEEMQHISTVTSLFVHFENVDVRCIHDTLIKYKTVLNLEKRQMKEGEATEKCKENRTSYVLAPALYMLQEISVCCESSTFMKLWYAQCQEASGYCSTLDDVILNVWRPVKKRWDTEAQQIRSGEIKFRDFEKVIGNRYKEEYHRMAIEMKTLKLSDTVIKKRLDQLKEYRKLDIESCAKAAMTLLMIAKDYKLKGDFQQIRIIANHGENDLEMRSFDDSVTNACKFLKEVTPEKEDCLKMFVRCRPLVQWLKESGLKAGLKELKVFVDLALISAGDEPTNVARVQCLQSAVTGYAPLIFELKTTSGYEELLKHCAVVWKELDSDPKLPEKLRDTNRQLQWLKKIKKGHGSVEVTSLMQAEAINANGMFFVEKNTLKKEAMATDTKENLLCDTWHLAHIDDLYTEDKNMQTLHDIDRKYVAKLFTDHIGETTAFETDDTIPRVNSGAEEMEWTEGGRMSPRERLEDCLTGMETFETGDEDGLKGTPLQLNDVLLDLQNVDKHSGQGFNRGGFGQQRLNVKGLILACAQAALSTVKDQVENTNKETDRVGLVLKLLHENQVKGQASFLHGVCCLIAKLLKEKESKTHVAHMAYHWLINEAAASENINKAGTFRRSCIQTLERKVSPILAGIIAYLDTNDNLKTLQEQCQWKQELWLTYLNTVDALNLQLTDLLSPIKQSDLQEVVVMTTGCEGHMFSAGMPFSWLLINLINAILKPSHLHQHKEANGTISRTESSVKVLREHAVWNVLSCVTDEQAITEAIDEYIHDFVHTMYHAASGHEHRLVCQSLYYVTNNMVDETTESTLLHSLVNVHIAYQKLAPRLTYFRAMNSVWPECSTTIIELKENRPDHFMFKEQEFTFSALCLLLENLSPKGSDLNNLRGRSHWLNKVHRYRPIVEKVISLHGEDPKLYGAYSCKSVLRTKGLWSRVMVVKLFLEHVCASEREDKITIIHCMPLWMLLGEETNLKEIKSLAGVEKFLKSCNKKAMKEYMGEEVRCSQCESVLEGPPITLPCGDGLCDQCYDGLKALGDNTCQKCHKDFEEDWQPRRQIAKKSAIDKLKAYQKRCNTFFMDVVSQLCFADKTAPSREVVKKLLSFIFFTTRGKQQRTRDLTIFDTGIDPNPVFRSFLLQHLIRTSEENVLENLEQYLKQAAGFINQNSPDQEQQYVELCLLVIQCLEDMFTQEANRADVDDTHYASQALYRAIQTITEQELTVEKLYGLASARMGLAVAARSIADIVMNEVDPRHVDRTVRKLVEVAQILCEDTNINWTRIYLVKHLCRSYGIDVHQTICRNPAPFLRWISIRDMNGEQVVEVSDRYIVSGDHYTTTRESVTKVLLGENVQQLQKTIQALHTAGERVEPMLQLAVHREITSSYLYPELQRKLKPQAIETINTFVQNCDAVKNKQFIQSLIMNQLAPSYLVTREGGELRLQGIQCLIVHFMCVMSYLQGERTLLQPLQTLMAGPQAGVNMFLPTMPQDDLEDIKKALLAARQNNGEENHVFYRCPNGHPYVIGNCGRPATVGNCRDCGAVIGGEGYQLRPGNILDQGRDNALTGHILGRAEVRGRGPKPERTLNPAYNAIIRLLLHLAMYVGAGRNLQGVHTMIKPDIEVNGVEDFLWEHIQLDVDDIHKALGRSVDDVLLLMHTVVDNIMRKHNEGDHVGGEVIQLSTKRGRHHWEVGFSLTFLQVSLQNIDNILKENNQLLVRDQHLGADPLLCMLYETESNEEKENPAELQEIPRVWRYRTPISLQHLTQEAEAKISRDQHKVLQLFLKEDHHLRALRYIPSILRLHRVLFQKYQRKLDKAEASQINIAQLKREEIAGEETNQLLQDIAEAWELVRESLTLYLCPTELGGMTVSKEYCSRSINDKTPVSMLLPTTKEAGLCSYTLLDFLMRKQNDFLDKYMKEAHRKSGSISSVSPREVTAAHLISYDSQHDILPLVLANCQYSFEIGKGTKIEYDFAGLERQLMDRFLFSKSIIDIGRVLMIEQMVYRTEFTNAEMFRKLANKIPQESLSAAVKTQLCSEIRSLPDLCTSLNNLDITICFLKSTGGQPDKSLHEFMIHTLQMDTSIHSQKAQRACEFKHTQSLWLLLSLQKSKKMIDNNQHTESTFESVIHEFHEELPDDIQTSFKAYMKILSIEKLSQLVEVLHEYILLVVAVRQNPEDEDYVDITNNKLADWLLDYVDSLDTPPLDIAILADFPKEILYKHSVYTWIRAYGMLREKQTGNYRRTLVAMATERKHFRNLLLKNKKA